MNRGFLPSFRLSGHHMPGSMTYFDYNAWGPLGFTGSLRPQWPATADSYGPYYQTPQTVYGSCDCAGGALRRNNCNMQQGSYRPVCMKSKSTGETSCVCMSPNGRDYGCFNRPGSKC